MKTFKNYKKLMANMVLTTAISLMFNCGVFAENSAVINQSGGGTASIEQSGKNNTATIIQGKRPAVSKKVRRHLRRLGNRAVIRQEGDHNTAHQTQSGEDNVALVGQKGEHNTATQKQDGKRNLAAGVQEGDDNTIIHSQTGDGHMQTLIEVGDNKTITVSQSESDGSDKDGSDKK